MNMFKIVYRDKYLSVRVSPVVEKFFKIVSEGKTFTSRWGSEYYYIPEKVAEELELAAGYNFKIYAVGLSLLLEYNLPNISMIRAVGAARNFKKVNLIESDIDTIGLYFASLQLRKKHLENLYDYIVDYVRKFEKKNA